MVFLLFLIRSQPDDCQTRLGPRTISKYWIVIRLHYRFIGSFGCQQRLILTSGKAADTVYVFFWQPRRER